MTYCEILRDSRSFARLVRGQKEFIAISQEPVIITLSSSKVDDDARLLAQSDEIFRSGEFLSVEESENFLNSILNAKS